jgi:branched-chain amino acid aminotransferase group I
MQVLDFDQRIGTIWFNGKLVPWQEAQIHIINHGLHYGSSVFEGERIYDGKVFKLKEHTTRLFDSAKLVGFEIPYSMEEIIQATYDVIKSQDIKNGYMRPIAWGGSDTMKIGLPTKINVAIACWEWPTYYQDSKDRSVKLCYSPWIKPDPRSVPFQSKAGGLYITCNLSSKYAKDNGYDDAIFIDYRGYVAEASSSNLFMVKDDIIYTAIADCFLNGITRQTVIEIAKSSNIKLVEKHILPAELEDADEIFLTGTAAEISPVGSILDKEYKTGKITIMLIEEYQKLVRSE